MKTSESVKKLAGCEGALEKLIGNIGPYLPLNQGFQRQGHLEKLGHEQIKSNHPYLKMIQNIVRPLKVRTKTAFLKSLGHVKFGLVTLHHFLMFQSKGAFLLPKFYLKLHSS